MQKEIFKIRNNKGITLVALAVTIIVLMILAGVTIDVVLGEDGLVERTQITKNEADNIEQKEEARLEELKQQLELGAEGSWNGEVNKPQLLTGMTAIKFTTPTEKKEGVVVKTNASDKEWYNYDERKWANAQTEDGSMWVWIPRYAYKITYYTDDTKTTVSRTKTSYGKIDVVFLKGASDTYYKEDGTIAIAQRQKTLDQTIDTTADYTVHPAFTNEKSINYANGGWDRELTGIWVAKFEAGYASGNNDAEVKASRFNYSQANAYVSSIERPRNEDGTLKGDGDEPARNWLDGIYGSATTSIKYPTFQGTTYSMNYINHNDSYNIARALTDSGNIYGFSSANADSHLMKNSEWGAVAYLSKSVYGQEETEIKTNNINLYSGSRPRTETAGKTDVDSIYAVTGCSSNNTDVVNNVVTIEVLNATTGDTGATGSKGKAYKWNQLTGQNASTTGTIYGVYDFSGGIWERTSSYIANENGNLKKYGKSIAYENDILKLESTKYTTVYPYSSPESSTIDTASQNNFASNTKIYGDAVRETTLSKAGTSESGWNTSSWNRDNSSFPALYSPFFVRGGHYWFGSSAGTFAFLRHHGNSYFNNGFRAVLVAK